VIATMLILMISQRSRRRTRRVFVFMSPVDNMKRQ
jgi:hypothetical protein